LSPEYVAVIAYTPTAGSGAEHVARIGVELLTATDAHKFTGVVTLLVV
jgi:hypothetical protein